MVRTKSASIPKSSSSVVRKLKPDPPAKSSKEQAVLVKKGEETLIYYLPSPLNPRSRSILVQRLEKSEGETKFESKEEVKINPKDILKHVQISKQGSTFTVSKQVLASLSKPRTPSPSSSSASEPEESSAEVPGIPRKRAGPASRGKTPSKPSNPSKPSKPSSSPQKKLKLEVYKKGVGNPQVTLLKMTKALEDPSSTGDFSISVSVNNKNVHRAVVTGNQALFKSLMKTNQKISSLFGTWSPDNPISPLEMAVGLNKEFFIREILKESKEPKLKKAYLPQSALQSVGTGFVSKQAYGVMVRSVNMSRGGREGNNAFLSTDVTAENYTCINWHKTLPKCTPHTINLLCTLIPNFENIMGSYVGSVVRSGNLDLSRHLLQILTKKGSFGFNFLHLEVLQKSKLSPFKKVSITKKPIENFCVAPLHVACINPDPSHLKSLMAECDEIGYADLEGRRSVHYAAGCTSKKPLEVLIASGANVNEMDRKKITPLMVSAMYNRLEPASLLLEKGVSPKIKSREGKAPIHYAAESGAAEVLSLLAKVSDVNQPGGDRKTPLMYAAANGHYKCVEILLDNGAKVTAKDKCKRTSLIWAVKNGYSQIASLLLLRGAPFDEPDSSKNYPIHYAAAFGWIECLELLLAAGADVNATNDWKLPALLIAMLKSHMGIVERILQEPAVDINCKDESGRTLLSQSVEVLSKETLKQIKFFIEEKKADPNVADQNGWTPLHHLAAKGKPVCCIQNLNWAQRKEWEKEAWDLQEEALELIIKGGAQIDRPTEDGSTPLILACKAENAKIVKVLVDFKADVYGTCPGGNVLHFLPSFDNQFLIQAQRILDVVKDGEKLIDSPNDEGYTPLILFVMHLAQVRKRKNLIFNRIKKDEIERVNILRKQKKLKLLDEMIYDETFNDEEDIQNEVHQKEENDDDDEILDDDDNMEEEEEIDDDQNEENADEEQEPDDQSKKNSEESDDSDEVPSEHNSNIEESLELDDQSSEKLKSQKLSSPKKSEIELNCDPVEIKLKTCAEWLLNFNQFLQIFKNFVAKGVSINLPVQKLKKYRENPFLAQTEESESNQNFIKTVSGQKIYKEYSGENGLKSCLHFVYTYFSPELINFLIEQGADINHQDMYGETPLHQFVSVASSIKLIQLFLDRKADPSLSNLVASKTALHVATQKGSVEIVELLLEYSPKLDVQDSQGNTPLIIASEMRSSKIVRALCQAGANPNISNQKGRIALHLAFHSATTSSNASFDIESVLLLHNSNINAVDKHGRVPLHYAFLKKSNKSNMNAIDPIETVSSACSKKEINVNVQDKFKRSPLHYAARRGALTSTMFLLTKGADIDLIDVDGNTALGLGIIGGHSNFVAMLLQRQVDIKQEVFNKKSDKKGALNYNSKLEDKAYSYFRACVRLDWQGAAYLLLFAGYSYSLAMQDALNEEKFELVLTLFAKVDDPRVFLNKNSEGQNLFHTLAVKGKQASIEVVEQIFQQLIDFKVDFDEEDIYGRSPLHYASSGHNSKLINLLLEKGAQINKHDKEGNTPLIKSVEGDLIKKSYEILVIFEKYKADFTAKVKSKDLETTIFLHAIQKECDDRTLKVIRKAGCRVTETDSLGRNGLMLFVVNNDFRRIKAWVKANVFKLDHQDHQGRTVIHYAISPFEVVSYENKSLLTFLLESGAPGQISDNSGDLPYNLASLQRSGRMKEVLEKFKIFGGVSLPRENSEDEEDFMQIDFKKDAQDYSESLDNIQQVEDNSEKPDPAGGFADYFKVVKDFDIYMTKVDVMYGPYSAYNFYRMQLLQDTNRDVYVVFTRWGRIGETGAFQRTPFANLDEAEKEFKSIFKNKSGNEWGNEFKRVKGKYMLMKFERKTVINKDYIKPFDFENAPKSQLQEEFLNAMKEFSKDSVYKECLTRYSTDSNRINFSNISSEQVEEAEEILSDIFRLVKELEKKLKDSEAILTIKEKICDLSNHYYELIPSSHYGESMVPPIQQRYLVQQEAEKLDSLRNIEIASKLILGALKNQQTIHPCDYIYRCLNTSIKLVSKDSPQFRFVKEYFNNGQPGQYKIKNLFKVTRKGEKERMKKYEKIRNRKLLWHGSPTSNFLGILSTGMKISPVCEAQHGRMLGNGLYFADKSSKSLNYAYSYYDQGKYKFLLLCEIVLGKVQACYNHTQNVLKSGYHSIMACANLVPDPNKSVYLTSGVEIPLGNYIQAKKPNKDYFSYGENEYVVFKEEQVRIRYLLQVKQR
jgi:ankyrin repeat protein/predicted DNA-binding WGR domain protein